MGDLALPYVMPRLRTRSLEVVKYRNALMAFRGRRRRDLRIANLPIDLTIDMTTTCQLSCPHCATGIDATGRPKLIMKSADYDRVLGGAGDACFIVWYFSNGEPLLNKHFAEYVARSRRREIFSLISTNLSFRLSDEALRSLLECGLGMIMVSLDGACAETYEQYRRGGDFNLVVDNMRRLLEMKAKLGLTYPLIEWRYLRFKHNEHEEARVRALAEAWKVDLLEFWPGWAPAARNRKNIGLYVATAPLAGPALSGRALPGLVKRQCRERTLARLLPKILVGGEVERGDVTPKCDWLYFSGMVFPEGRLGPCCLVSRQEADFVEDIAAGASIGEAFNSPRHLASRASFVSGEPAGTICDSCPGPSSQYYQFRMKVRAILRNAPDWVVRILAADPGAFFYPEDRLLAPEVDILFTGRGLGRLAKDGAAQRHLRATHDLDAADFGAVLAQLSPSPAG